MVSELEKNSWTCTFSGSQEIISDYRNEKERKKKKMENRFMLLPPEKTWKKVQRRVTGAMKGMEQFLYKKQLMGQGSSVRRGNTADMSGESKWGIIVYHL